MLHKTLTFAAALALMGCAPGEKPAAKPAQTPPAAAESAPAATPKAGGEGAATTTTAVLTVEGMGSPFG